jgi:hypothetical protein
LKVESSAAWHRRWWSRCAVLKPSETQASPLSSPKSDSMRYSQATAPVHTPSAVVSLGDRQGADDDVEAGERQVGESTRLGEASHRAVQRGLQRRPEASHQGNHAKGPDPRGH